MLGERLVYYLDSGDLNTLGKIGIHQIGTATFWDNIINGPQNMTKAAGIVEVKYGSANSWRVQILYLQNGEVWSRSCYIPEARYNSPWVKLNN